MGGRLPGGLVLAAHDSVSYPGLVEGVSTTDGAAWPEGQAARGVMAALLPRPRLPADSGLAGPLRVRPGRISSLFSVSRATW